MAKKKPSAKQLAARKAFVDRAKGKSSGKTKVTKVTKVTKTKGKSASKKKVMTASQAAKEAQSDKDMGKKNNGKTTGFKAVQKKAMKKYKDPVVAKKVAGAQFQKMRKAGQL